MHTNTATTPSTTVIDISTKLRCDRCGAQAYVVVRVSSVATRVFVGELNFCAHHFAKADSGPRRITENGGQVVLDVRERLLERANSVPA